MTDTGPVSVELTTGIRLIPEMMNLYQTLMAHGFDVYVCSASFADVIIPIATEAKYGYGIPLENVYAMGLVKNQGVIQTEFDEDYVQTQGAGKTETIQRFIVPQYASKGPFLVAGDSDGDLAMLSDFDSMEVGLIINRLKGGGIGELSARAIQEEGQTAQRFYLQGRDENRGKLVNMKESILLGETRHQLRKESSF